MKQLVAGHASRVTVVVVFEPAQSPEQVEVELDRFLLGPGENREIDIRSATAGYRLVDPRPEEVERFETTARAGERNRMRGLVGAALTPDQQPRGGENAHLMPETPDELEVGAARQAEVADRDPEDTAGGVSRSSSGPREREAARKPAAPRTTGQASPKAVPKSEPRSSSKASSTSARTTGSRAAPKAKK